MTRVIALLKQYSCPIIHCAVVATLLAATVIAMRVGFSYAMEKATEWTAEIIPQVAEYMSEVPAVRSTEAGRTRLRSQFNLAQERAKAHLGVAKLFVANYYMSTIVSFVIGVVVAISLFFIMQGGWGSKPYVQTVFIASSAIVTFFGAFPYVFQQPQNIASNLQSHYGHVALQHEILTYAAAGLDAEKKALPLGKFLVYVDSRLSSLNQLAITLDPSKVPTYKFDAK